MPIVLISEALLLRATAIDGRLLRDRVLCGFCVRMNARKRSFRIATSEAGRQFRMTLGYWRRKPCSRSFHPHLAHTFFLGGGITGTPKNNVNSADEMEPLL